MAVVLQSYCGMSTSFAAAHFNQGRVPKFQLAFRSGRLLELRMLESFRTASDIEELSDAIWEQLEKTRGRVVICSDYRLVSMVLSPERAEEWGSMMSATSHRVERSAILLDKDKATFNLQLRRVVVQAGNRDRRFFFEEEAAKDFLGAVLNDDERDRVSRFCSGETLSF